MEGIRKPTSRLNEDVAHFAKGCEYLLSALASREQFTEIEKELIEYYCLEIVTQTKTLRDGQDNSRPPTRLVPETDTSP